MRRRPVAAIVLRPIHLGLRCVQYQQTCETTRAIETGDKKTATKWMTKSSQEYLQERDKHGSARGVDPHRQEWRVGEQRSAKALYSQNEKNFENEMSRLADFKQRRFQKTFEFFKRQGVGFFVVYVAVYVGCFIAFYTLLAKNVVSKATMFEILIFITYGAFDRESFLDKVAAWDTYINFGFAFVLNEMLEVVRLPIVMATFFTFRPSIMRAGRSLKTSMFRRGAPEI